VEELQEALEQATKGIAALATGPWSGPATQSDGAASAGPAQGATGKKSASKGTARTQGANRGKFGCGGMGRRQNPKTDPWWICKQPMLKPFLVNLCHRPGSMSQLKSVGSLSVAFWTADAREV